MEQKNILLIGEGRLAHHLRHYLGLRGLSWHSWNRHSKPPEFAQSSKLALLAVSDDAIEPLAKDLPDHLIKIHFSGSVVSKTAIGIHPLMTFGSELFEASFYDQIPLVMDEEALDLEWVKALPNPKTTLPKENKALYHSLCHLGGNFPKLLWENIFQTLESQLKIPRQFFLPYLEQVLRQVTEKRTDLKSGPFGRGDQKTIEAHLVSLKRFPELKETYTHFYETFKAKVDNEFTGNC